MLGLAVLKQGKTNVGAYATYADIWEVLQPALYSAGLSFGCSGARVAMQQDVEHISMDFTISDGEEEAVWTFEMIAPERIVSKSSGASVTNNAQRVAAGTSFLKRTALIHAFSVATGKDMDEVERMTPGDGQTNIPGAIIPAEDASWQNFTEGGWRDVLTPMGDRKLEQELREGEMFMAKLWLANLHHPGLCAWQYDRILDRLNAGGYSWADVAERDESLPTAAMSCTPEQLLMAGKIAKQLTEPTA